MKSILFAMGIMLAGCFVPYPLEETQDAPVPTFPQPEAAEHCQTCLGMLSSGPGAYTICLDEYETFIDIEKCRASLCTGLCLHTPDGGVQSLECMTCMSEQCEDALADCLWGQGDIKP